MTDSEIKIIPTRYRVELDGEVIGVVGQTGQCWVLLHKDGSFTRGPSAQMAIARKLAKSNVDYRLAGDE